MLEALNLENIRYFYSENDLLLIVSIMAVAFYPITEIFRRSLVTLVTKSIGEHRKHYGEILKKNKFYKYFVRTFASMYLLFWQDIIVKADLLPNTVDRVIDVFIFIYAVIHVTLLLSAMINVGVDIFKYKKLDRKASVSLQAHIIKIILYICATLIAISHVLHISISGVMASLGAVAALLTFVFKDSILGLLASLQITLQDIVRVGDWITIKSLNVDGDVEKITITTISIREFNKTLATIPTGALLNNTVINWRKMKESGGRRIKRAINIDVDTIKMAGQKDLNAYKKLPYMNNLLKEEPQLFANKEHVTNVAIFRHYIRNYLEHHDGIHKENFTFLIRQLDPTPTGLPIELYIFTTTTDWIEHEEVQSEIFEHIYGILPSFGLRAFQYPAKMIRDLSN